MTKFWRCSNNEALGALYIQKVTATGSEWKQLSTNSKALMHCLATLRDTAQVKNCGLYLVLDNVLSDSGMIDRPRDYFYSMPGLVAGLALNKIAFREHSGITFTFLDSTYGFLQAIDQAIADFSCKKIESSIVAYAGKTQFSSSEDGECYGFALVTRSADWLEKVRPNFFAGFYGAHKDLIEKFDLALVIETEGLT